ncbi:MAG: dihydrofolate reductase [Bacteroidia bacterium]
MWSIVAAAAYPSRIIGRAGKLPWRLPLELRLFRELTWGGILVMGRRTWESLPQSLPGREVWVLSRQMTTIPTGRVFSDTNTLIEALQQQHKPVFFVGGEAVFRWAIELPMVNRLYLTWIFTAVEGDTIFPEIEENIWQPHAWELFHERCISFIRVEYHRYALL